MKFLLLNQTFYPDVASTAQHLSPVAEALAARGHEVTVISSRRAYNNPEKRFPRLETWKGVRIMRVGSTGFGKETKWRRGLDFASFLLACLGRMLLLPKQDAVLALTSPPLISFLGASYTKLRGGEFYYWVMDFNPDEAIAAGWLRTGSPMARCLEVMSRFALGRAKKVIVLDEFMRERIVAKGNDDQKIHVIPPFSQEGEAKFDSIGRERFRKKHGLEGKFVVMYSGNHSPCHPLDTLLKAAQEFTPEEDLSFCFVGGGSEFRKVQQIENGKTIRCFPYQPLGQLGASLSAADVHIVVMGDAFVGLVHPCKIYNILAIGSPVICIGPQPSHISEIFKSLDSGYPAQMVSHGDVQGLVSAIRDFRKRTTNRRIPAECSRFSSLTIIPQLLSVLDPK